MMKKEKVKKRKIKQEKRSNAPNTPAGGHQTERMDGMQRMTQAEINRAEARAYWERRRREEERTRQSASQPVSQPKPKTEIKKKSHTAPLNEKRAKEMEHLLDDIPSAEQNGKKAAKKLRDQARKANSKRHRKRRKRSYTLYYLFVLLLVLITGITLSVTVFFNIQQIKISGSDNYTADQIASLADVSEGDNLFRLNLKKMRQTVLEQATELDDVTIRRDLPETLVFELTPAEPTAVVLSSGKYYLISSGLRIIRVMDTLEGYESLLQISGMDLSDHDLGDFLTGDSVYENLTKVLTQIKESKLESVQGISIDEAEEIQLNYQNRIGISLGSTMELSDKLALAGQIITENVGPTETGVLDVSRLGTAYFRPMALEEMGDLLPPGGTVPEQTTTDNSSDNTSDSTAE
jgi:cell division septal protein FtsQ